MACLAEGGENTCPTSKHTIPYYSCIYQCILSQIQLVTAIPWETQQCLLCAAANRTRIVLSKIHFLTGRIGTTIGWQGKKRIRNYVNGKGNQRQSKLWQNGLTNLRQPWGDRTNPKHHRGVVAFEKETLPIWVRFYFYLSLCSPQTRCTHHSSSYYVANLVWESDREAALKCS